MADEPEFVPTPSDPSKEDPELKKLLNDLAQENGEPVVEQPVDIPVEMPSPKDLEEVAPAPPTPVVVKDENDLQISAFVKKFGEVANDILGNYKADRDQINDTIEYLENIVFNAGGQRVHMEMLVAALRTKAETNASTVKVLDSLAKFLAATKGTNVFVQNNHTTIQDDLQGILAKGPYLDEMKRPDAKN